MKTLFISYVAIGVVGVNNFTSYGMFTITPMNEPGSWDDIISLQTEIKKAVMEREKFTEENKVEVVILNWKVLRAL